MAVAAIVCEGQSDHLVLRAVIERIWPEITNILLLQPILDSASQAQGESGSSGVKTWCTRSSGKLQAVIDSGVGDVLDLLVIALDADSAVSAGIEDPPARPSAYDASRLCSKIRGWLGLLPPEVVIVIPSMAIESWIVAARFKKPANPETIANPAKFLVEKKLLELDKRPKRTHKVVKPPAKYRAFASQVAAKWTQVTKSCAEARRFDRKVRQIKP